MIYEIDSEWGPVLIEVEDQDRTGALRNVSNDKEKKEKIGQRLEDSLKLINRVANSMTSKMGSLVKKPDEFSMELGLKFKGKAGFVIAQSEVEGHIKVTLKWKKDKEK